MESHRTRTKATLRCNRQLIVVERRNGRLSVIEGAVSPPVISLSEQDRVRRGVTLTSRCRCLPVRDKVCPTNGAYLAVRAAQMPQRAPIDCSFGQRQTDIRRHRTGERVTFTGTSADDVVRFVSCSDRSNGVSLHVESTRVTTPDRRMWQSRMLIYVLLVALLLDCCCQGQQEIRQAIQQKNNRKLGEDKQKIEQVCRRAENGKKRI
jgi:hypothetical protein